MRKAPHIVVACSGRGADAPFLLQPLLFRPLLHHVLEALSPLGRASLRVVAEESERSRLREGCRQFAGAAFEGRPAWGRGSGQGPVLVVPGDAPLLTPGALLGLLEKHARSRAWCTIATGTEAPSSGRAVYCFEASALNGRAAKLFRGQSAQSLAERTAVAGRKTQRHAFDDPQATLTCPDLPSLAKAEAALRLRVNRRLLSEGVWVKDLETAVVDPRCRFGRGVELETGVVLVDSVLHAGVKVEAYSRIVSSVVGPGTRVKQGSYIEDSEVGADCDVGPYAHLRPGSRLERDVRVGNFVEVKKSRLGTGARAAHLSYIGDADIGRGVNVGCGFITCNYSGGKTKHKTIVEDGAFIGSDSQAVAPVRIGKGALVASGTTVTEDVPPGALVLSRGRQVVKEGYARKRWSCGWRR